MVTIIGEKKKKVFGVGGIYDGCYLYRLHIPFKYIQKYECVGDMDLVKKVRRDMRETAKDFLEADYVLFQRPCGEERLRMIPLLKAKGKKIIFENDDTFKIDEGNPTAVLPRENEILDTFLRNSDLVTTTTEFLAREYKEKTDFTKVSVVPNYIDFEMYPEKMKRNKKKTVRIGLVGSVIYLENTEGFKAVLDEIVKWDVKLIVLGFQGKKVMAKNPLTRKMFKSHIGFFDKYKDKVEFWDYVPPFKYPEHVNNARLDFMLIPRKDNYFNRAKSNIKFLEAGALKIPVVAQSFGDGKSPYEEIEDGVTGFKANTNEDWLKVIETLFKDKNLREEIRENSYNYVKDNYDIANHFQEWETVFNKLNL